MTRAERRLATLALETSHMLTCTPEERRKDYGTEGLRLVLQGLRDALDQVEAEPAT